MMSEITTESVDHVALLIAGMQTGRAELLDRFVEGLEECVDDDNVSADLVLEMGKAIRLMADEIFDLRLACAAMEHVNTHFGKTLAGMVRMNTAAEELVALALSGHLPKGESPPTGRSVYYAVRDSMEGDDE